MKIISLTSENFKRLQAVEIRPGGNLVEITGRNGQGKSSVLDSIWAALAGKDACPSVPIRKGKERARIKLDLGELVVTRTFVLQENGDYTTQIAVENAQGARYPSPQRMIDALLGELTFDPLAFARMDAKAQFNALRRFCPDVDFDAIANADRGDRDRRTELGRFAKQERAAAQLIVVPPDTPEQAIDESALVADLTTAADHNTQLERRIANREAARKKADGHLATAERLHNEAQKLRQRAAELDENAELEVTTAKDLDKKLDEAEALPQPLDVSVFRTRIDEAREINANVRKLDQRMKHHTRAQELEKQIETLTAAIDKRQTDKQASIAAAKMPVEGLTFGEGVVLLNGVPFEQASDAEQLRASVAIAAALNPKLRVIRVRDGSLLDEDSMRLLAEIADKTEFQIWVERVDSTGQVGFVLEDGHLRQAQSDSQPNGSDHAEGGATTGNQSIQRDNLPCPPSV